MGELQELVGRIAAAPTPVPLLTFGAQMLAAAIASAILAFLYVRFGQAMANRRALAANFIPITLTTMFIITVVRSSLALSLGLVGALSIVRFRTAIREPEELIHLFVCIALGLGFGAGQWLVTLVAFAAICIAIIAASAFRRQGRVQASMFLLVNGSPQLTLSSLESLLRSQCRRHSLRRFDGTEHGVEATFSIELPNGANPDSLLASLRGASPGARIMLIDQQVKSLE